MTESPSNMIAAELRSAVRDFQWSTSRPASRCRSRFRADIASWSSVNDDMVALIEQIAASGVRLALLSNAPEELAAHYEQHHTRWLQHFELIAFSCRVGQAEPQPEAFRWCCHKLGVTPERILFIDDRTENVHTAQRLGIHTHLFIGPTRQRKINNTWQRRVAGPAVW